MAKKKTRKPSGAAGIEVFDDSSDDTADDLRDDSRLDTETRVTKPALTSKSKSAQQSNGNVGVSDIKKAASFANSVGGLDKAIGLLQILKVAKDVQ